MGELTGRDKIIRFKNHFHGWSDYAVPGWAAPSGVPDGVIDSMIVLEPNDISQVEQAIAGGDVAGVILEPTGAHMGQEPINPTFLEELRQVTEQNGVVYIMDEVVTGFRTSRNGASGYYGVVPDLSTHAKILGGGLPGACVAGKADIIDMIQFRDDADFNDNGRIHRPPAAVCFGWHQRPPRNPPTQARQFRGDLRGLVRQEKQPFQVPGGGQ